MKRVFRGVLFFPLNRGKSGAARIGGGERSEPVSRILFMPYDTESQSRNVLASPLGEEGHEVAKGWTVVRMIMILDVDVTAERRHYKTHRPLKGKRLTTFCASLRSGGRRLAVRKMIECHISAQPRTPFPTSRDFPSRGNEKIGGTGYCVTYDTDSQSRNADFISIAAERQSATLGAKGPVKLKNPPAVRPVNPKNPHTTGVSHEPSRQRRVARPTPS